MVSTRYFQFPVQKNVLQFVMLTCLCGITVCDSTEVMSVEGYYGGEVQFQCPADKKTKLLYLQKGEDFVNGYYDQKNMTEFNPWPNSRVDRQQNIIYVSALNISHSGVYTCHFQYEDNRNMKEKDISLKVTANYTKPSINVINCTDKLGQCLVQCLSSGYPKKDLSWNIFGEENSTEAGKWKEIGSEVQADNRTELFNLSSTAAFNCNKGKVQNISCSVDGVTTFLPICQQETHEEPNHHIAIATVSIVLPVLVILAVLVFGWKCKDKIKCCKSENGVI